jgi:hypothetical protein
MELNEDQDNQAAGRMTQSCRRRVYRRSPMSYFLPFGGQYLVYAVYIQNLMVTETEQFDNAIQVPLASSICLTAGSRHDMHTEYRMTAWCGQPWPDPSWLVCHLHV